MSKQEETNREILAPVPLERQHFSALILSNPNYFGNSPDSPLTPVNTHQNDTTYEEIGCVGFQPQQNRLEAAIHIKRPTGYGGDVCGSGSTEYVRFYLSEDQGSTWRDLGLSQFTVYDHDQRSARLDYAVTLTIEAHRLFCRTPNVPLVRAILSWQAPPPPHTPLFNPTWGHAHDTHIQIEPRRFLLVDELLQDAGVKLSDTLKSSLDLSQQIPALAPKLETAQLAELYQDRVEPHRYALPEIKQYLMTPTLLGPQSDQLSALVKGIDPGVLASFLHPVGDGNTTYERLNCIGLAPYEDTFVGILRINKTQGYSGNLCTAGSTEYVTFWADFDGNGSFETYLGTASVNVHDIEKLPAGGLDYAVRLPFDLSQYRQPCKKGPRYVRIRAILSWQTAAPSNNPNHTPYWGNRLETTVMLQPGQRELGHTPIIKYVGNVLLADIDQSSGLATGSEKYFTVQSSPFGGAVWISGQIANAASPLKYRVSVSQDKVHWEFLTNTFYYDSDGVYHAPKAVDADGYYTYDSHDTVTDLAQWQTAGKEGLWFIRLQVKDESVNPPIFYNSSDVTVCLDNTYPQINVFTINTGGGDCADFVTGETISGTYDVTDLHFSSVSVRLLPAKGGPANVPIIANPAAMNGTWTLNTSGLPRCGYAVELVATDRTIVNSVVVGWNTPRAVGLCLREPTTP